MTAQPARPLAPDDGRAAGLRDVRHVIAVSSCKGGALPCTPSSVATPCLQYTTWSHCFYLDTTYLGCCAWLLQQWFTDSHPATS